MAEAMPNVIVPERLAQLERAAAAGHGDVITFRRGRLFLHPDAVRDMLVTYDKSFRKSRVLRLARWTLGNGLLTSDGDLHRRQRPIIQPTLHTKKLAGYARIMSDHAAAAASSWADGRTIDVHEQMTRLTLRIVADALFGTPLGPEVDAISTAMDFNVRAFMRLTTRWGPALAFVPTPFAVKYLLSRRKVQNVLRGFISKRRSSGEIKDDLLGRLVAAKTPDGKPAMSERQLVDECVTLFAAGHETTANALAFTLMLLASHPDVQSRLGAEVDVVASRRTDDSPAEFSIEDADRLVYARAVLAESMRLYPPAWIQGREAIEDVTIAGLPVRRGQTIFACQWLTHRDPRWWPDPLRFDPDRPETDRPRWSYFPFGGGSRSCIGEAFAWAELVIVLATIVRRWRFEPTDSIVRLEPGITLRPIGGIRIVVRSRTELAQGR